VPDAHDVIVYWRPMCGYCETLKAGLLRRGIEYRAVDIWADRTQAEVVKGATGGDEIVPTVQVGRQFLVNPSVDQVAAALAAT
jgi:glutaredoxin-like protein